MCGEIFGIGSPHFTAWWIMVMWLTGIQMLIVMYCTLCVARLSKNSSLILQIWSLIPGAWKTKPPNLSTHTHTSWIENEMQLCSRQRCGSRHSSVMKDILGKEYSTSVPTCFLVCLQSQPTLLEENEKVQISEEAAFKACYTWLTFIAPRVKLVKSVCASLGRNLHARERLRVKKRKFAEWRLSSGK